MLLLGKHLHQIGLRADQPHVERLRALVGAVRHARAVRHGASAALLGMLGMLLLHRSVRHGCRRRLYRPRRRDRRVGGLAAGAVPRMQLHRLPAHHVHLRL